MAITKILARNNHLNQAIQYVLNSDKTDGHILTAHQKPCMAKAVQRIAGEQVIYDQHLSR